MNLYKEQNLVTTKEAAELMDLTYSGFTKFVRKNKDIITKIKPTKRSVYYKRAELEQFVMNSIYKAESDKVKIDQLAIDSKNLDLLKHSKDSDFIRRGLAEMDLLADRTL